MIDTAWFDLSREAGILDQINRAWTAFGVAIIGVYFFLVIFAVRIPGFSEGEDALAGFLGLALSAIGAYAAVRYVQSLTPVARRRGISEDGLAVETTRGARLHWDWSEPTMELELHDAAMTDQGVRRTSDLTTHDVRLVVRSSSRRWMFSISWPVWAAVLRAANQHEIPVSKDQARGGGDGARWIENRVSRRIPVGERMAREELTRLLQLAGGARLVG